MDYINFELPTLKYAPDVRKRFDLARFVQFREGACDIQNSVILERLPGLPTVGNYTVTEDAGRPDMVSSAIYGDTQYWWLILYYNSLVLLTDLSPGKVLRFFSLSDLSDLVFELSQDQLEANRNPQ
jgi:hypothetical protein